MLIDLARKPLFILPDECRGSIVVRTMMFELHPHMDTRSVVQAGSVTYATTSGRVQRRETLQPVTHYAHHGGLIVFETRLPLPDTRMVKVGDRVTLEEGLFSAPQRRGRNEFMPSPYPYDEATKRHSKAMFEVGTVTSDVVSGSMTSWFLRLQVEQRDEKTSRGEVAPSWTVTVLEEPLRAVVVVKSDNLVANLRAPELTPLQRLQTNQHKRVKVPRTAKNGRVLTSWDLLDTIGDDPWE